MEKQANFVTLGKGKESIKGREGERERDGAYVVLELLNDLAAESVEVSVVL